MSAVIEEQVERYAPGFRTCIEARHVMTPAAFRTTQSQHHRGDINGGVQDLAQLYRRPTWSTYRTPYAVFTCVLPRHRPAAAFMECVDFMRHAPL
jgi:phytoene dehydrogenase-like protein